MTKLYSYVVDHDHGFGPNPFGGFCTLAKCKWGRKRRNIVELAEKGDWIVGTGGADLKKSAGHGKMIYAMKVDDKIALRAYCQAHNGDRSDAEFDHVVKAGRYALISNHFYYFGRNAIDIADIPAKHLHDSFEKTGRGFRHDFSEEFIDDFAKWLNKTFKGGIHGAPCQPLEDAEIPKCPPYVRRK